MPRFSRRDAGDRRQQILEIALDRVGARGWSGVTLAEVAAGAGVTKGLVHHYFGSLDGLRRAVAMELATRLPEVTRTDLDLPLEQLVARNVDAWLDALAADRAVVVALHASLAADPVLQEALEAGREATIDRILLNHLGTTEVPGAVRFALRSWTAMALAAAHEWVVLERAGRPEVHALLVTSLLALTREGLPAVIAAAPGDRPVL